jgi:hypothetical protein
MPARTFFPVQRRKTDFFRPLLSKFSGANRRLKASLRAGHSLSCMENHALS